MAEMVPPALIAVELCGRFADPLGPFVEVTIPAEGCRVDELIALLRETYPALGVELSRRYVRACIDETLVGGDALVTSGRTVALLPPLSGG